MDHILVDGFIVISKNWNFLPLAVSNMSIKFPLLVRPLKKSELKCCELGNTLNDLYQIQLCQYSGMDISIVIQYTPNYLQYSDFLNTLYCTIDDVLNSMKNSLSYQRMIQITGTSKSKNWTDCNLLIYLPEIRIFGEIFEGFLNASLCNHVPLFLGKQFGQNCPANIFRPIFQHFNLSGVTEAILHLATDIYKPNKVPMWRKVKLESTLKISPTLEYYIGGIPGVGNFYFYITGPARANINGAIAGAKFYSSLGKHIHAKKTPPFSTPRIANDLLQESLSQSFPFSKNVCKNFRTYKEDLSIIADLVQNAMDNNHYARCEVIIRVKSVTYSQLINIAEQFYDSLRLESMLSCFCSKEFQDLMQCNMNPCLSSIKCELDKWTICNSNNTKYIMNREDYLCVCTSELILCFLLRGNVISSFNKPRHDNELSRILGFARQNYAVPLWRPAQIFSTNSSSYDIASLVESKVHARFVPYFMKKLQIPGCFDYCVLVECFETTVRLKEASRMVLNAVLYCICCEVSKKRGTSYSVSRTHTLLRATAPDNIELLNSFTALLFMKSSSNVCIRWIINECDRLANTYTCISIWNNTISQELENRIINSEEFICLPGLNPQECGVVVPFLEINKTNMDICLRIVMSGLAYKYPSNTLFNQRLYLIYSRSVSSLSHEARRNINFKYLMSVLDSSSYNLQNFDKMDENVMKILAFPFP